MEKVQVSRVSNTINTRNKVGMEMTNVAVDLGLWRIEGRNFVKRNIPTMHVNDCRALLKNSGFWH